MGKKLLPKLIRGKRFIIPFKETAIKLFSRNDIVWLDTVNLPQLS